MQLTDLFTAEEIGQIRRVYSPGNSNIVHGTAYSGPDFFERLGLHEEGRRFWKEEWNYNIPEQRRAIEFLHSEIKGKRVIELGPGLFYGIQTSAHYFQELGASEYVGVEPLMPERCSDFWCAEEINRHFREGSKIVSVPDTDPKIISKVKIPVTVVTVDALSYLLHQPDDSAIVYSSRTFRPDVMFEVGLPPDLARTYVDNLIRQIEKVTPNGAISLHVGTLEAGHRFNVDGFSTELWMLDNGLPSAGEVSDKDRLEYELKSVLGFNGLLLRKRLASAA